MAPSSCGQIAVPQDQSPRPARARSNISYAQFFDRRHSTNDAYESSPTDLSSELDSSPSSDSDYEIGNSGCSQDSADEDDDLNYSSGSELSFGDNEASDLRNACEVNQRGIRATANLDYTQFFQADSEDELSTRPDKPVNDQDSEYEASDCSSTDGSEWDQLCPSSPDLTYSGATAPSLGQFRSEERKMDQLPLSLISALGELRIANK